jgi:hypothetical protein
MAAGCCARRDRAQSPSLFIHFGAARGAPRRTPPAVGAGWCDGRGELRGMRSMAAGCCAQRYWVTWHFWRNALRQKGKWGCR